MIKSILVVCVGNICRSPMAKALLEAAFPGVSVDSAGVAALEGRGPDPKAIAIMKKRGFDISQGRSKAVSEPLLALADLVLVMDEGQKMHIATNYPQFSGKIMRLGRWGNYDIPDPYLQCDAVFEDAYRKIAHAVESWKLKIA